MSDRRIPQVGFELQYFAPEGVVRTESGEVPIRACWIRRSKYRPGYQWEVECVQVDAPPIGRLEGALCADAPAVGRLELLRFRGRITGPGGSMKGEGGELRVDLTDLGTKPDRQTISAFFSPAVATYFDPVGDEDEASPGNVPAWDLDTPAGAGEYALVPRREEVDGPHGLTSLDILEPTLYVFCGGRRRRRRIRSLAEDMGHYLDDLATVLTHLSRNRVSWTELSINSEIRDPARAFHLARVMPTGMRRHEQRRLDRLIAGHRMEARTLDRLVTRFRSHPLKGRLRMGVRYTVSALHQDNVEAMALFAFAGFEAVVGAWSRKQRAHHLLRSGEYDSLRKRVKPVIKEFADERGFAEDKRERLYEKLGELKRAPIGAQSTAMVRALGLEWRDLWSPGADLADCLDAAYTSRNRLFHGHGIDPIRDVIADSLRIACLAERAISRLLEIPDEVIHPLAYWFYTRLDA